MFTYICFALALTVLVVFSVLAIKNRHSMRDAISFVLIGIFFTIFFMVLPTNWTAEKEVSNEALFVVLSSLHYSLKALGGGESLMQLESICLTGFFRTVYIGINYVCLALSPILASSLILSFLGDTGNRIRYALSFGGKCCVFSELNENTLSLARGIKKAPGKKTLVFCNTKNTQKDLLISAKKLGAITLYKRCNTIRVSWRFRHYEFYLLSDNEDENIELTEDIIGKKAKLEKRKILVNAFVQNSTNIQVLESMVAKKPCAVFEGTHEKLLEKAGNLASQAPQTKLIFFGASNKDDRFAAFAEAHNVKAYETSWDSTQVDEAFKEYDMTLYGLTEKDTDDGKKEWKVSGQGIGYRKGRLVAQWQEAPLKIRFIDEISLLCNNLLFAHPLYDLPAGRKDIFVLLVGCGRLGRQMLKTVTWYGQIPGYTLKIRVLDQNASAVEKAFLALCPEINKYDIVFENIDIHSADFETKIASYADATFVCVATDSDERNLSAAESLYRIFRRSYADYTPPIFCRVRKTIKSKNFEEKGSFLGERKIHLFGTSASVFSNDLLFKSNLDDLAFAVHLCYNWALDAPKDSFSYKKALNDYCTSEYARRSSMAAALHIPAKLRSCGILPADRSLPTAEEIQAFETKIKDEALLMSLAKAEHDRWNAFMRSEGFRGVDFETVRKYAPITRSHKDEAAKLHPCILSWDDLDDMQIRYDELQKKLNLKPSNFKEYDIKIVEEIPQIIRKARQLSTEGW